MSFKNTIQIAAFSLLALVAGESVYGRFGTRVQVLPKIAIDPRLDMPPEIALFVQNSCGNCHTSETNLPWYAKIPPVSWMVHEDVVKAHRAVDFTNWASHNGRSPVRATATLLVACADMKSGRMPLPRYLWMHPEAKPRQDDVKEFCAWANQKAAAVAGHRQEQR